MSSVRAGSALLLLAMLSCGDGRDLAKHPPIGAQRCELGCLDAYVSTADASAIVEGRPALVVRYWIGNRCDHAVELDLGRARVVAEQDGDSRLLVPYDPQHEIRVLPLRARSTAHESIAYVVDAPASQRVRIDLHGIADAEDSTCAIASFPPR